METENTKATGFVQRLLANPALNGFTPLQREEQILQFLQTNGPALLPTLTSQAFFPGTSPEKIMGMLQASLRTVIDAELLPDLKRSVDSIDFKFIAFIRQQNATPAKVQETIAAFLGDLLTRPDARRHLTGGHAAVSFRAADRYVEQAFVRKEYVHFELTRGQRLRMGKDEIKNVVKTNLLTRSGIHLLSVRDVQDKNEQVNGLIQTSYVEKVAPAVCEKLLLLPEEVVRSALASNVSFDENRMLDAVARVVAIFAARCRNYKPGIKVDRGADTPDKSWFSIARRNFRFYGFDIKMVDEFYKTAAENGW